VRLIHALNDEEVPFQMALDLADRLSSSDVHVQLIKGEGAAHAMDDEVAFNSMRAMIADVRSNLKREASWFSKKGNNYLVIAW
jgi:ribose 5-phosphate isomerase